jgi:hypothetical protein
MLLETLKMGAGFFSETWAPVSKTSGNYEVGVRTECTASHPTRNNSSKSILS